MLAYLNLRYSNDERAQIFKSGLEALGYQVVLGFTNSPAPGDILVTWNRIRTANFFAKTFQRAGNTVLVAENATWGNGFAGRRWLHIARDLHNTAGKFTDYGPERFDSLGIELKAWRQGTETLILAQRGIGSPPVAMPSTWPKLALKTYGGRIRSHPGMRPAKPLEDDLKNCGKVVTWGSGAAVKALVLGVPAISEYSNWIAAQDNTDQGRLAMFRRLAWAQWEHDEIKSGEAFKRLLD